MTRHRAAVGLVVVASVGMTSCGGTSKADFITAADAVCRDSNRQLAAAGPLPRIDVRLVRPADLPSVTAYLDRVLPILHAESARLHELGSPVEDGATVDDVRMFFDAFVSRLDEADRAARTGVAQAVTPALDRGLANGFQAQTIAGNYGFSVCGKLPELNGS